MRGLWLRWYWRDLRSHWTQVLTTALILAVGIGAFAGLGGMRQWREDSTTASLSALRAHDVRLDLADGSYAPRGALASALGGLPRGTVAAAEERLVVGSQIDASRAGDPVLVPARVIGIPSPAGGRTVDALSIREGGAPRPDRPVVLDWNFARHYGLPVTGTVRLAGVGAVRYSGLGVTPQYVVIVGSGDITGGESALAVVYAPLALAQRAAGRGDEVNELVVRAGPGSDPRTLATEVRRAGRTALPGVATTVTLGADEGATRIQYRDARNDQKTYWAFAFILLAGATLAAFNLVSRVVEAQRREIGIGMALGAEPGLLARRPLVLGLQIGTLGAALGVPVGLALSELIRGLVRDFLPLPVYASSVPVGLYVGAAILGVAIPVLASVWPIHRAVGVDPVEAIRTGHRSAGSAGAVGRLRRLPGRPIAALPLRNLARTPRRTLMTVVGLGATITAVVAVLGMVDAIDDIAARQETDLLRSSPERLEVALSAPVPTTDRRLQALAATPGVAAAEPGLAVEGRVRHAGVSFPVALLSYDADSSIWAPVASDGSRSGTGVLLAEKAARDLGVGVGDTVQLEHPRRDGGRLADGRSTVRVIGLHPNPVRVAVYANGATREGLGLGGVAPRVTLRPGSQAADGALQRALFGRPGIASVAPAVAEVEALRTTIDAFGAAIRIVVFITLGLATLVAFTSTSISLEERRREYATMFAFGLPARYGLRVSMTESLVIGVLGTLVGLALGTAVANWIVTSLLADTFPDLSTRLAFQASSLAITLAVGVLAVTAAPLATLRRMRRMDVPSTLRTME
ncbi:FtsX-like permease family protein [Paraconexibacter sp.]|uniref:FtsX-like permease family protein n=1 Tax=Paraconexibacter sp. TaxID=2949640 RepID=UPI0035629506